jgi:hypothetical protein
LTNSEVGKLRRVIPKTGDLARDGGDECLLVARARGKGNALSHRLQLTLMNNLERIVIRIEDLRAAA